MIQRLSLLSIFCVLSVTTFGQTLSSDAEVLHKPEDCAPEDVEAIVLTDIQGMIRPEWHDAFASKVKSVAFDMIDKNKVYQDPELWGEWERQLNESVIKLTAASGYPRPYELMIVKDPNINAFALEGGFIFVNVGLLAHVENMDQLRMILAHEMAHIHHHHSFLNYVKMRKAQNAASAGIVAGALLGGVAGYAVQVGSQMAAHNAVLQHSREQETEADQLGAHAMKESEFSISEGLEVMRLLHQLEEKNKIETGHSSQHWLYGSTHPDSESRYHSLIQQHPSIEGRSVDPKNFESLRNQARLETLKLLNAEKRYRNTIEAGWSFLLKDADNKRIREEMFVALEQLKDNQQVSFLTGYVLISDYHTTAENKSALQEADVSSDEAKDYIRAMLLMLDSEGSTPFPINITFRQLHDWIQTDLAPKGDVESILQRATRSGIDRKMLNKYIDEGGQYVQYAQYLLSPDSFQFDRNVILPLRLEMFDDYSRKTEYEKCFAFYDWRETTDLLAKKFPDPKLFNLKDEVYVPTNEAEALVLLSSLYDYTYMPKVDNVDLISTHPAIAEFLLRERVKTLITLDYFESKGRAKMQMQTFEVSGDHEVKRVFDVTSDGGNSEATNHLHKKIKKLYKYYDQSH